MDEREKNHLMDAMATVIGAKRDGYLEFIRYKGEISGVWLKMLTPDEMEPHFMRMVVADENVSESTYAKIAGKRYRRVQNSGPKGGWYIMIGEAKAPCEQEISTSRLIRDEFPKQESEEERKTIVAEAELRRQQEIRQAAEARQIRLRSERTAKGACVLCGTPLGFLQRFLGAKKHKGCSTFTE